MNKNIFLFFLLTFCMLSFANETEKSFEPLAAQPQAFEIDITTDLDKLPISTSDIKKTRIVHRYVHNCSATLMKSTISIFWCEQLEISAACKEYSFKEDKHLDAFLFSIKNDQKYAEKFRNILPGVRYTIPYSISSENARTSNIIPCVFCPHINHKDDYQHAIVFDTQNVAICDAIKAHYKTKNYA